ncbi:pilin [Patescibacteria group bacterium]|nr:pilin [Patescibacteria group bacterium]
MKKFIVTAMIALMLLVSAAPALAAIGDITAEGAEGLGLEYGERLGLGNRDIRETIAAVIRVALGLLGIVAVVIILIGGFTWMTAGGNDEKVEEAKKRIFQGVIGLAIILSAYALASFVINQLITATTTT